MLARSAVAAVALLCGAFAFIGPAQAADPVLDGTYRLDFDGANRTINGAPSPIGNTSATYSFTSSCAENGCVARAILLSSNDTEAVSAHNPDLTLQFVDGTWQLSLPYDSPCEEGDRNQLLTWSLTPQSGAGVLSGIRTVATVGQSCAGDDAGPLAQPMTATRVGSAAPGVLPMP